MVRALVRSIQMAGYFLRFGTELAIKRPLTREARANWLHRFCAAALRGMDIRLNVHGQFPAQGAVIANHTGYMDIVTFAAIHPCVYCAKAEIRQWPIIGWMTVMTGTVFVERGRGESALRAKAEMKAAADAGVPVVFFPEGKTSSGAQLLPFQSGLLAQVMALDTPLTPAYIRYSLTESNGSGITVENDISWWGERSLTQHIWRFLGLRGVQIDVYFARSPIEFVHPVSERKLAAVEARDAVLALSKQAGVALAEPVEMHHP